MADNDVSLIMRIKTLFEGSGSKEAAANVAAIGKASQDMSDKSKAAAGNTEKAFSAINSATAVTEGGVMGVGNAVKNLAGQFPALNAALGPVGLALAAFAAWKKTIDAVRDSRDSLARGLRDTAVGNAEASIRSLAAAYDRLQQSISDAEDARKRLSDAEASKDDARLAADLARLELAQAKAQAGLAPGDALGRRRVDLDFAGQRSALTDAAALRRSDREAANISGEGATLEAAKAAAAEQIAALESKFSDLAAQQDYARAEMERKASSSWTPAGREAAYTAGNKELADITASMQKIVDQLTSARGSISSADRSLFTLDQKAEVNRIARETLITQQQTGSVSASMSRSELSRDVSASRAQLMEQLASQSGRVSIAQQQAEAAAGTTKKEWGDVWSARGAEVDKQLAEYRAAAAKEAEFRAAVVSIQKTSSSEIARLLEVIRSLPNN